MLAPKKNNGKKEVRILNESDLSNKSEIAAIKKEFKLGKNDSFKISEVDLAAFRKKENFGIEKVSAPTKTKPEPKQPITAKLKTRPLDKLPSPTATRVKVDYNISTKEQTQKKFVPEAKTKRLTKPSQSVAISNIGTTAKNIVNKARFGAQEKMAKSGERALRSEGTVGSSTTERRKALGEVKSNLKEIKKMGGSKLGKNMRDVNKGIRYEKKVAKGRDIYKR